MGRNFLPAINDFEKVIRRKSTPIPLLKLCKIGRKFCQRFWVWAISFATHAMTAKWKVQCLPFKKPSGQMEPERVYPDTFNSEFDAQNFIRLTLIGTR
jgi:hypothetical protein